MSIRYNEKSLHVKKIVCVGRNYVAHIEELKNEMPDSMVLFMKPSSAISEKLSSTHLEEVLHYEAEICFLIEDSKIGGVGFGLDLTKRELQSKLKSKSLPWERAKCFNGAALFSDFVDIKEDDIQNLHVRLFIDDELVQDGKVEQMIYKPDMILEEVSSFTSLEDNDIIMSGTPKGVGVIQNGSEFKGQILIDGKVVVEKTWVAN